LLLSPIATELVPLAELFAPTAIALVLFAIAPVPTAMALVPVEEELRPRASDPLIIARALLPMAIALTLPVKAWTPPAPAPDNAPPPIVMPLE
jgi:hypothetical protein